MASPLIYLNRNVKKSLQFYTTRYGHTLRGRPPATARTLSQRLAEENQLNDKNNSKVNIGFPQIAPSRSIQLQERLKHLKLQKSNPELEKLSRNNELVADLKEIRQDWLQSGGPFHLKRVAEHYGIFEHLFDTGFFVPRVSLTIKFNSNDAECYVYSGNVIKPCEANAEPNVVFDSKFKISPNDKNDESWWSLVLTNPDGHFEEHNKEYVHWFVGNIPNGDVAAGERIVPYIQPFPAKGTGFQRFIFVLYKQEKKLDFSEYKVTDSTDLKSRTFKTFDFYVKHQDSITPAGLSFFQSEWERELTEFYHTTLNMVEPIYEYDFPKAYIKDQKWFPLKEPFNLYMDKYRDQKVLAKEYVKKKLAKTHPFEGPEPELRFPNAHPIKGVPSWLKTEIKKDRLRWGRINDY